MIGRGLKIGIGYGATLSGARLFQVENDPEDLISYCGRAGADGVMAYHGPTAEIGPAETP